MPRPAGGHGETSPSIRFMLSSVQQEIPTLQQFCLEGDWRISFRSCRFHIHLHILHSTSAAR